MALSPRAGAGPKEKRGGLGAFGRWAAREDRIWNDTAGAGVWDRKQNYTLLRTVLLILRASSVSSVDMTRLSGWSDRSGVGVGCRVVWRRGDLIDGGDRGFPMEVKIGDSDDIFVSPIASASNHVRCFTIRLALSDTSARTAHGFVMLQSTCPVGVGDRAGQELARKEAVHGKAQGDGSNCNYINVMYLPVPITPNTIFRDPGIYKFFISWIYIFTLLTQDGCHGPRSLSEGRGTAVRLIRRKPSATCSACKRTGEYHGPLNRERVQIGRRSGNDNDYLSEANTLGADSPTSRGLGLVISQRHDDSDLWLTKPDWAHESLYPYGGVGTTNYHGSQQIFDSRSSPPTRRYTPDASTIRAG
ncbi:hypothetical protein F5148DRAFT_1148404 [Russula earlei]|uniref:Uncharacterized protein n=1 Tax=Russula earlei TaxID=71964 RepID=A0ACC0UE20_9AGAM|nr:hypothetical protein F5148DRAFT_1148404 [Russula earlei]